MANPFVGTNIHGCNSPALGAISTSYPATFDLLAEKLDGHTHVPGVSPNGKGIQIPTNGISDLAITHEKLAANSVDTAQLAIGAVTTPKILDANVTTIKRAINRAVSANTSSAFASSIPGTIINIPAVSITVSGTKPVRVELVNGLGNTGTMSTTSFAGFMSAVPTSFVGNPFFFILALIRRRTGFPDVYVARISVGAKDGFYAPLSMFAFTDPAPTAGIVEYFVEATSKSPLISTGIWGFSQVSTAATEM